MAEKGAFSYEVIRSGEETILRVDCEALPYVPSIEDNPVVMARTIELLAKVGTVTKIVFVQKRDYEYDLRQVSLLQEIATIYRRLVKRRELFSVRAIGVNCIRWLEAKYATLRLRFFTMLREDPVGAYVMLRRAAREERLELNKVVSKEHADCLQRYIALLDYLVGLLDKTRLIALAKPHLVGYSIGDRSIYRRIFRPVIKPDFMFTKLMASYPAEAEAIDSYYVGETEVTIFKLPRTTQYLYHVIPPEFKLKEDHYDILDTARRIMAEHKPTRKEFVDPERMRRVFYNVGRDLLSELAEQKGILLREKDLDLLTQILVRYTVGFGLIEVILADQRIQDITINSPMGMLPMFVVHADYGDCITNIIPTAAEAEGWASKLRMISGRPLDEANPILDSEIILPVARARVCVIAPPLTPMGLGYAFRRHRDRPWTLPLFIANRMINPLTAGLLSFLVDGTRTMLIAGTRSAGKTSFLGSLMVEIMRRYRIVTIEDVLELPVNALKKLNFNIQSMKVRSALARGGTELPADEGIRTALRLGDSALIIGEVRSKEALALYEAMRIGAMANLVAGTIHGESPYGVFDRVVNDLGVPRTSFKATDLIVIANPIRSPDGLHRWRRIVQVTEVRKHWETDPLLEHGFVDLLKYNPHTDQLEPTSDLINGDSDVIKAVAANVKEWAGNWSAVWDNIMLRAKIKETLVNYALKSKQHDLLEAEFVVVANDQFHTICEKVKEEIGSLDSKRIFSEWESWLKMEIKRKRAAK